MTNALDSTSSYIKNDFPESRVDDLRDSSGLAHRLKGQLSRVVRGKDEADLPLEVIDALKPEASIEKMAKAILVALECAPKETISEFEILFDSFVEEDELSSFWQANFKKIALQVAKIAITPLDHSGSLDSIPYSSKVMCALVQSKEFESADQEIVEKMTSVALFHGDEATLSALRMSGKLKLVETLGDLEMSEGLSKIMIDRLDKTNQSALWSTVVSGPLGALGALFSSDLTKAEVSSFLQTALITLLSQWKNPIDGDASSVAFNCSRDLLVGTMIAFCFWKGGDRSKMMLKDQLVAKIPLARKFGIERGIPTSTLTSSCAKDILSTAFGMKAKIPKALKRTLHQIYGFGAVVVAGNADVQNVALDAASSYVSKWTELANRTWKSFTGLFAIPVDMAI